MASGHLVNPKPDSHWVPETSMHQRLSDLLIPSYRVLLWLQISVVPKPPCFGPRLYPPSGCWQGWKGSDKTQRDTRGLLVCWNGHCHCAWSLETFFNMHFSDPVATPRFCVSFLLMAPVGEPIHRLSLRECSPVTCFGFVFSGFIRHWLEHARYFFFFFWINVLNKV